MRRICYHGTDAVAASSILQNGFSPDTWFAKHLEDAIIYGGLHVFEIIIEEEPGWQFRVPDGVAKERIASYDIYCKQRVFRNSKLYGEKL